MFKNKSFYIIVLLVAILLMALSIGNAAVITVNSSAQSPGGGGDCTLGESIQAANTDSAVDGCAAGSGADIISMPGGTYTLSAADNTTQGDNGLPDIASDITINGSVSGPSTLITRGVGAPLFRIFHIAPTGTLSLNNLTIDNGSASTGFLGGGIHNNQGTLSVTICSIINNTSDSGGGISNAMGAATITNSFMAGNHASSATGGGIYNAGGTLSIMNTTIYENTAFTDGGGIYNSARAVATITESSLSNNSAGDAGGGIYNTLESTFNIHRCALLDNQAQGAGGGALLNGQNGAQPTTINIDNSTISGNTANTSGGGFVNEGTFNAVNVTITNNTSTNGAGGGLGAAGIVNIRNSIIYGNTNSTAPDCSGSITAFDYSLIGSISGCTLPFGTGNLINSNPLLGPLQNNGGPTLTHALPANSPAVNAGNNVGVALYDQRGAGYMRISNGIVDMGAYELQSAASIPTITEWGMIIFMVIAGIGSVYYLRRRRRTES